MKRQEQVSMPHRMIRIFYFKTKDRDTTRATVSVTVMCRTVLCNDRGRGYSVRTCKKGTQSTYLNKGLLASRRSRDAQGVNKLNDSRECSLIAFPLADLRPKSHSITLLFFLLLLGLRRPRKNGEEPKKTRRRRLFRHTVSRGNFSKCIWQHLSHREWRFSDTCPCCGYATPKKNILQEYCQLING